MKMMLIVGCCTIVVGILAEFTKDFVNSSYNLLRDWPDGRGVWTSNYPDLVTWVNTEDHIRMVVACDGHSCQESLGILIQMVSIFAICCACL